MIKLKAIIKHCQLEGTSVCYFKSGKSYYKITGKKHVRKMSYESLPAILWGLGKSPRYKVTPVFEDEQVLLNGVPVHLSDTLMHMRDGTAEKYGFAG